MWRKRLWIAVVVLVFLSFAYVGWLVFWSAREAANIQRSRDNLKQIGLALHAYHEKYDRFPPAYVLGPDGKPWHSWRVLLLPFLDENSLYERYRFDEPWNGPHNRELHGQRPKVYASPLQKSSSPTIATYQGVMSRRTMWPAHISVRISDVTDGTSNTIHLVENEVSDVIWSEPREMHEKEILAKLRPPGAEGTATTTQRIPILLVDGTVRMVSPQVNRDLFVSLLTPKFGGSMSAGGWPREERPGPSLPEVVDISNYPGTRVVVVPEASISVHQNSLYCATVQLAWDLLRPSPKAPIFVTQATVISDKLNEHPFPKDALSPDSYFAGVGDLSDAKSTNLLADLHTKFPSAPLKLLPNKEGLPGVRLLAYLQKSMPFPDVMEPFLERMPFLGEKAVQVKTFGWPSSTGEGSELRVLKDTVEVLDYVSNDNFVIVLHTDGPDDDEIILAKVAPEATLQATWESVESRINAPSTGHTIKYLRGLDELRIPIVSFGVVAPLQDLIGLGLPTEEKPLRYVADAVQTMRFRIDEYGAELIADTQMIIGDNGDGALHVEKKLPQPRHLVFNRPFLMILREKKASVPYFLAWIGNVDLMETK